MKCTCTAVLSLTIVLVAFLVIVEKPVSLLPTDQMLSTLQGQRVKLSFGYTHFQVHSNEAEHLAEKEDNAPFEIYVLVHGFSQPSQSAWPDVVTGLLEQEITQREANKASIPKRYVITYDNYGRGGSDAVHEPHTAPLFSSQLAELLLHLQSKDLIPKIKQVSYDSDGKSSGGVTLIGWSMGGAIAAKFATTHPNIVRKVVLIAPAGLPMDFPLAAKLLHLPRLPELLLPLVSSALIKRSPLGFYDATTPRAKLQLSRYKKMSHFQAETHPGYVLSLINTLRNFPMGGLSAEFDELLRLSTQKNKGIDGVLTFWGEDDAVTPFKNANYLQNRIAPNSKDRIITYSAAGHNDPVGKYLNNTLETLQEFLRS